MPEEIQETTMLAPDQDTDNLEEVTDEAPAVDDDVESDELETNNSNAAPQKMITGNSMRSPSPQRKSARDDERYDFEHCTVLVLLQLMPLREGQSPDARKVFVTARTHSDPPYVMQLCWDELAPRLPNEIHTLLERLQQDLPRRAVEQQTAQEAERQRQTELEAESENRRAARKEKASSTDQANTKQAPQKRTKKIDLNAPPVLSDKESILTPATDLPSTANRIEPEPSPTSAQMTMF